MLVSGIEKSHGFPRKFCPGFPQSMFRCWNFSHCSVSAGKTFPKRLCNGFCQRIWLKLGYHPAQPATKHCQPLSPNVMSISLQTTSGNPWLSPSCPLTLDTKWAVFFVAQKHIRIYTFWKFNSSPLKIGPNPKGSRIVFQSHHFSGASC